MDEATNSLNKMQRELDQLSPVFEASRTDVQVSQETVEACQKEYTNAKEKCKKQELDIELMQGPIEILKKAAQAEFEKVRKKTFVKKQLEKFNYYSWKISHAVVVLIISSMKGQKYQILIYVSRWRDNGVT